MKEDIDAIIVGQIKGVLDQWEEPYRPEDWEKLQRKRKKDRRGILWLPLRYAGLLLVLFTTGVLVHYFSEWGAKETPDLPLEQIKERVNRDKKEQENPFKHTVRPQQHRNTPDDTEVTASQEKIGVRIQSKKGKNIRSPAIELRTQAENKARKNHLNGQRDSLKELFHSNDLEGMALKEGTLKNSHGIVGNGWYFKEECEVKFWRQSNKLVQGEKIWDKLRRQDPGFTCANLFWWYNMYANTDYNVTPRPNYLADGRKIPDIYSNPANLRDTLQAELGTFPLFHFWGPKTSIKSSQWIADAALRTDQLYDPTLTLIYLPHLDYNLQRHGTLLKHIAFNRKFAHSARSMEIGKPKNHIWLMKPNCVADRLNSSPNWGKIPARMLKDNAVVIKAKQLP